LLAKLSLCKEIFITIRASEEYDYGENDDEEGSTYIPNSSDGPPIGRDEKRRDGKCAYTGGAANIPRQPKSCWIYSRGLNYGRDMYGTRVGPEMWAMK